jgi:cytochrome c peroxidase
MRNKPTSYFTPPRRRTSLWRPLLSVWAVSAAVIFVFCIGVVAQNKSSSQLREFIGQQVGGLENLVVPAEADIPTPLLPDGTVDPLYITTEAKRYLGKQLFHDPVRMVRIRSELGGVPETAMTASCGSCHLGEAASKAGTLFNFAAGGEGRGYTDADGNFIPRRRPNLAILPQIRETPLFPGDALVDELPTLTDIYENAIGTPARGRKQPDPGMLLRTGRLDAVDSVARNAPSVIGFGFNNRMLMGGFAGEPDSAPGGLNPFNATAGENLTLLLLDAHRMLEDQAAELQKHPVYVQLFREAFPEEAAQADAANDMNMLINDMTVLRATATFLRTVVTRDTPWDKFLAGDDAALTPAQQRGAELFFTSATEGGGGCYACHSGPMLNKQVNDPDVAGVGQFVEENFYNLGLADHPLQALNKEARHDANFRDDGRREVTFSDDDAFEFRVLTLRQLKDARFFFHNGSFTSVRDVVQYFNAGVPQDEEAAVASTFTTRFSHPRGPDSEPGLGLSEAQVDDLTDFIENGLYDPTFVSSFMLTEPEMKYSEFRPDLMALGAVDGRALSGLPQDNNDPLSRRDMGLEFLNVTPLVTTQITNGNGSDMLTLTNNSSSVVDTHLLVIVQGLPEGMKLSNASGMTKNGDPYLRVFLKDGVLNPGESINEELQFEGSSDEMKASYRLTLLSGQGNP